jgi:hypothetical protein
MLHSTEEYDELVIFIYLFIFFRSLKTSLLGITLSFGLWNWNYH